MKEKVNLTLRDYVCAGYPGIIYKTNEESRAIDEAIIVARKTSKRFIVWSETTGIRELTSVKVVDSSSDKEDNEYTLDMEDYVYETVVDKDELTPPDEGVLIKGLEFDEDGNFIFVVLDYHSNINTPLVWRTAKDCFEVASRNRISFIFISSTFEIPKELEHYVASIEMDLPKKGLLHTLASQLVNNCGSDIEKISESDINDAAEAAMGLTLREAEDAMAMSLFKIKNFDAGLISEVKRRKICEGGLLKYTESNNESLETVGGMRQFTGFVQERLSGFSEEAREENIPYPKGVLLVGIPGCGKSLAAKALANMWNKPLLQLDLGKLFGSLVGETEERTRDTLKLAEAMAPCILWLDEIEKGLSGVSSSGATDSGVTSRMFGTILTWLQEKDKPVFVIATANDVRSLPDELLRKGRFDEIFFVDLPTLEERKEIFDIQIKKYVGKKYNVVVYDTAKKGKNGIDLDELAELTDGFSGAEIESVITTAKYRAFNEQRAYTMEDLRAIIAETPPASKGFMHETVEMLRQWSERNNIRNANVPSLTANNHKSSKTSKKGNWAQRQIVMINDDNNEEG